MRAKRVEIESIEIQELEGQIYAIDPGARHRLSVAQLIVVGQLLRRAKQLLTHGTFSTWAEHKFRYARSWRADLMNLAKFEEEGTIAEALVWAKESGLPPTDEASASEILRLCRSFEASKKAIRLHIECSSAGQDRSPSARRKQTMEELRLERDALASRVRELEMELALYRAGPTRLGPPPMLIECASERPDIGGSQQ